MINMISITIELFWIFTTLIIDRANGESRLTHWTATPSQYAACTAGMGNVGGDGWDRLNVLARMSGRVFFAFLDR